MKADPTRPINVVPNGGCLSNGIDLLTHMSIEFTKALLSNPSITDTQFCSLDHFTAVAGDGIQTAKELIKQLNEEK